MKKIYRIYTLLPICCGQLSAQGRIDKVIDSMEGKPDVETTYTERRSPKKKKLMMTSRIFNFENTFYFEKNFGKLLRKNDPIPSVPSKQTNR